jgi:PAS domain S-box-containing protein
MSDSDGRTDDRTRRSARERLLAVATEPLFTATPDGRFDVANDAFRSLVGYESGALEETPVTALLHDDDEGDWQLQTNLVESGAAEDDDLTVRLVTNNGTEVPVDIDVAPLAPDSGDFEGLACRVTDQRKRRRQEQKLNVLNRALRHNIRNRMNLVLGNAALIRDADDESYRTAAERIEAVGNEIITLADKARKAHEHLGIPDDADCRLDLVETTQDVLRSFAITYPGATVRTEFPERALARAPPSYEVALTELLENAVVHHPSGQGPVTVAVRADDPRTVHVRDECDPIPDAVVDCLVEGEERPLEHNEGLGLWLVQWTVETVGGDLRFGRRPDGEGNEVTLAFDPVEP